MQRLRRRAGSCLIFALHPELSAWTMRLHTITTRWWIAGRLRRNWNSSEHMASTGEYYRWGAVVDHKRESGSAGGGSCIFIHIWGGPGEGTTGCTAMAQGTLEPILAWLDPAAKPVLVQLPVGEYRRVRKRWKLPRLAKSLMR